MLLDPVIFNCHSVIISTEINYLFCLRPLCVHQILCQNSKQYVSLYKTDQIDNDLYVCVMHMKNAIVLELCCGIFVISNDLTVCLSINIFLVQYTLGF